MKYAKVLAASALSLTFVALAGGCQARGYQRPAEFNLMLAGGATDLDGEGGFEPVIDGPQFSGRIGAGFTAPAADFDGLGSGIRIGGRVGFTATREEFGDRPADDTGFLEIEDFIDLTLISPQITVSYRQQLTGDADLGGLFIEPGIGGGAAVGILSFGQDLEFGNDTIGRDVDDTETEVGFSVQPYLRFGYDTGELLLAAEGGYMWTDVDFEDDLGADPREAYVGFHLGIKIGR